MCVSVGKWGIGAFPLIHRAHNPIRHDTHSATFVHIVIVHRLEVRVVILRPTHIPHANSAVYSNIWEMLIDWKVKANINRLFSIFVFRNCKTWDEIHQHNAPQDQLEMIVSFAGKTANSSYFVATAWGKRVLAHHMVTIRCVLGVSAGTLCVARANHSVADWMHLVTDETTGSLVLKTWLSGSMRLRHNF